MEGKDKLKEKIFTVILNSAISSDTTDEAFSTSTKQDKWSSDEQSTFVPVTNKEPVTVKNLRRNARIVGPLEVFRYATIVDIFMILIGIMSAAIHGMCLPFLLVVYGTTLDEFAQYSITIFCEGNVTDNCTTRSAAKDNLIHNISHPILLYYCIIGLVSISCGWLQVVTFKLSSGRQIKKIRTAFFYSIIKQEISWFDCNTTGEINSWLNNDLEKIAAGTGEKLAYTVQAIITILTGLVVGFIYLWQLALLIIGCAPVLIVAGVFAERITAKITAAEQVQYARAGAVAQETIGSIRTVIAYGGQEKEAHRYTQYLRGAKRAGLKKEVITGFILSIYFIILFGIGGLAYWFCGYLITNVPSASIRDVVITLFTLILGAERLSLGIANIQDFSTARGAAGALFDIIDMEPKTKKSTGMKPKHFENDVEISYVSFSYPSRPEVKVLNQLNVSVSPGQTLALVGPSGCGKSTVVQLIQRFYDASEGRVKIGGYDVRELDVQWLRQQIGVVSQESVLFATTIAENIRYGKEGVTQAEIEEAAKAANAHSFIKELPDGYNTLVGERGTQLSGGQKQRIAIARALVRDPKILLLDEATSALDTESEAQVQAALDKARQGRTTIVIAHRLSTIQGADIIALITNGREAEIGTHTELLQMKGIYFDLIQSCKNESGANDNIGAVDFTALEKALELKQGIPDSVKTLTCDEIQSNYEEEEDKEEESQEEVTELITSYSTIIVLWRTLMLNKPEILFIMFGLVFAIISGLVYPSLAVFIGEILEIFTNRAAAEKNARFWAGLIAALGVCAAISLFLRSWCFAIAGQALTSRLRKLSFKNILRQDMSWFDQPKNSTGKLTTRLSHDAAQVQGAVGVRFGYLVEIIVTFITAIVIAFYYSWSLTLLILGFMPFIIISLIFRGYIINGETTSSKKGYEESSYIAYETIDNIRTVKSLNLEEKMGNLYTEKLQAPHKKSVCLSVFYGLMYALSDGLIFFMYTAAFRFAAFLITLEPDNPAFTAYKEITITIFALVIAAVQSSRISVFLPNYSKAILSARRVFKLLDVQPVIDSYSTEGLKPEEVKGNLELDKVHFTYPSRPNIPVLQGLSISVEPGEMLALVGPSGCGKSTVVSLLERLYYPDNGLLNFDGKNLKLLNIQWLRRQIGVVSQEPVLFNATIADNIRYGANFREVTDEEVEMAAQSANIHNFIMTLPEGYNTNVGLQGTQLSGGQKQRVAIARALIRDPKILLLDEATSALDAESEKVVQEALDNARKGRTSIVIAHRLSTIHNADCIAVIKDGVVIEAGIHSQLMEQRGAYYKLNKAQVLTTDD